MARPSIFTSKGPIIGQKRQTCQKMASFSHFIDLCGKKLKQSQHSTARNRDNTYAYEVRYLNYRYIFNIYISFLYFRKRIYLYNLMSVRINYLVYLLYQHTSLKYIICDNCRFSLLSFSRSFLP